MYEQVNKCNYKSAMESAAVAAMKCVCVVSTGFTDIPYNNCKSVVGWSQMLRCTSIDTRTKTDWDHHGPRNVYAGVRDSRAMQESVPGPTERSLSAAESSKKVRCVGGAHIESATRLQARSNNRWGVFAMFVYSSQTASKCSNGMARVLYHRDSQQTMRITHTSSQWYIYVHTCTFAVSNMRTYTQRSRFSRDTRRTSYSNRNIQYYCLRHIQGEGPEFHVYAPKILCRISVRDNSSQCQTRKLRIYQLKSTWLTICNDV